MTMSSVMCMPSVRAADYALRDGFRSACRSAAAPFEVAKLAIDVFEIDEVGIEGSAGPYQVLVVLGVISVSEDLEELGIAVGTADVFGRTAA